MTLPDTAPRAASVGLAFALQENTPAGPTSPGAAANGAPKLSVESIAALKAIHGESEQLDNKYFRNQMTKKYLMDYIDM